MLNGRDSLDLDARATDEGDGLKRGAGRGILREVAAEDFASRDAARAAIFDYIEVFYNRQRRHSALNYETPLAFEARTLN